VEGGCRAREAALWRGQYVDVRFCVYMEIEYTHSSALTVARVVRRGEGPVPTAHWHPRPVESPPAARLAICRLRPLAQRWRRDIQDCAPPIVHPDPLHARTSREGHSHNPRGQSTAAASLPSAALLSTVQGSITSWAEPSLASEESYITPRPLPSSLISPRHVGPPARVWIHCLMSAT
jgi:hypothetical protein